MAKKPAAARSQTNPQAHGGHADAHGHDTPSSIGTLSNGMDYAAHEAMYHRFTGLVKWGIISTIVVVLFLFIVIHPMVTVAS